MSIINLCFNRSLFFYNAKGMVMNDFGQFELIEYTYSDRMVFEVVDNMLSYVSPGTLNIIQVLRYVRNLITESDISHLDIPVTEISNKLITHSHIPLNLGNEIQSLFTENMPNVLFVNYEVLENLELNFIRDEIIKVYNYEHNIN
tara:strand:- start:216 stop:650 length:435 start_codon:yes stop_codon:yes gene_type:complete